MTPLVVGDKLYVCSMTNTMFVFDVNTGAELARRQLAIPFDPRPDPGQMDRWKLYHSWGITATPVIDVPTNTIYVTTFGKPNIDSQNTERNNMLFDPGCDHARRQSAARAHRRRRRQWRRRIANGFTTPYQKLRAGLGLLTDAGGSKAVIVSFSINGENPRGPGHGFVVAYDARGLHREAGFTPTPAIWNVTPGGGAGGVWMSGSGPAIDGNDIYLATGNGMDPGTMADNFAESFVRLRYTAGVAGVDNGKPKLVVADFWGAFSDFGRQDEDQDLGAAGVFIIPERGNLIGGGKDGILYNLNKDNLGKNTLGSSVQSSLRRNVSAESAERRRRIADDDASRSELADRQSRSQPADADADGQDVPHPRHAGVHGGRDRRLRLSCGARTSASKRTTTISRRSASLRFALKGRSSRPATWTRPAACREDASWCLPTARHPDTGVVWGVYPTQGNANSNVVHGALVAYDATRVLFGGRLRQLFHSDDEARERHGELRQVLDADRCERKSLRRHVQQQGGAVRAVRARRCAMKNMIMIAFVALPAASMRRTAHDEAAGELRPSRPRQRSLVAERDCRACDSRSRRSRRDDVRLPEGRAQRRRA